MPGIQDHIVQRSVLRVNVSHADKAYEHQNRVLEEFQRSGMAVLAEVLDELVPADVLIQLDALECDLGSIPANALHEEFAAKLRSSLREALLKQIGPDWEQPGNRPETLSPEEQQFRDWISYLTDGKQAWNQSVQPGFASAYISQQLSASAALDARLMQALSAPAALERLILQLDAPALLAFLNQVAPDLAPLLPLIVRLMQELQAHLPVFSQSQQRRQALAAHMLVAASTRNSLGQGWVESSLADILHGPDPIGLSLIALQRHAVRIGWGIYLPASVSAASSWIPFCLVPELLAPAIPASVAQALRNLQPSTPIPFQTWLEDTVEGSAKEFWEASATSKTAQRPALALLKAVQSAWKLLPEPQRMVVVNGLSQAQLSNLEVVLSWDAETYQPAPQDFLLTSEKYTAEAFSPTAKALEASNQAQKAAKNHATNENQEAGQGGEHQLHAKQGVKQGVKQEPNTESEEVRDNDTAERKGVQEAEKQSHAPLRENDPELLDQSLKTADKRPSLQESPAEEREGVSKSEVRQGTPDLHKESAVDGPIAEENPGNTIVGSPADSQGTNLTQVQNEPAAKLEVQKVQEETDASPKIQADQPLDAPLHMPKEKFEGHGDDAKQLPDPESLNESESDARADRRNVAMPAPFAGYQQLDAPPFQGEERPISKKTQSASNSALSIEWRKDGSLYVNQSGLVLLNPFFLPMFQNLGWVANGQFVHGDAQENAVMCLAYMASGQTEYQEGDLALAKVLCGMEVDKPVRTALDLEPKALEEAEEVLRSASSYWEKAGPLSPDQMRGAFLMREGRLKPSGFGWELKVERVTIDILLEFLPWGYGTIMLPWMNGILSVEW